MARYRKKPIVVEAVQFHGAEHPLPFSPEPVCCYDGDRWYIATLEGDMTLTDGDWVIRGVKGEYYPCKPDIFEATYEAVE